MKPKNKSISSPSSSLKNKLKVSDLEKKNYVKALEAENLRLQKQIAKLQVKNMSLSNRIKALIKEIEQQGPSFSKLIQQATEMNLKNIVVK